MLSKLLKTLTGRKTILMGSGVLGLTTILSYVLGLLRDRMLATTFGATRALDAYNAAFILPDLILNIFVAGALSAAFVPIFSKLLYQGNKEEVSEFMSTVLNSALLVVSAVAIGIFIFVPELSKLTVPGFSAEQSKLYIRLVRILLLSPIIFAVSNTMGGILVSREKFTWFGLSAPLYNLGIIGGIIFLHSEFGIFSAIYGAIAGALMHLAVRMPAILNMNLGYEPIIKISRNYKKFLRLMAPKMIGQPIDQLTFLGFTIIASSLGAGSIAILTFARNFQYAPVAIIGISLAVTVFPVLSRQGAANNRPEFLNNLFFTLKTVVFSTLSAAIIMYLLRFWLVGLLLGGGEFGHNAIIATGTALGILTMAIPTESVNQLLARAFYSLQNSITPVIIAVLAMAVTIISGYILSKTYGINGLVAGFVIGSALRLALLALLLRREVHIKLSRE